MRSWVRRKFQGRGSYGIMSFMTFLEVSYFIVLRPMDREGHSAVIASKSLTVHATAERLQTYTSESSEMKRTGSCTSTVLGITFETRLIGIVDSDRHSLKDQ